ncbi:C4-dicarboxylate ABC transporter permease [Salipiger aestuarii]|uniref:TRAP transporter large permease protein n=1 Tax=Salipiger aestuarii TaxID=568098 RepID=A0A327Y5F4_9RHOB|nr:TRAP transporter large permease [Salipiger aestuarii]EIE50949.1 TRAP dicarboxylate transporter, DctM subunit [Citreicella sp. 357]KAA8607737.1 C4-dicarboxylate ABC transporter permease [Salipiger aestuarii]KAA8609408.1 C4-dicarboxylate ABC transporter permease [Salipiger aestuarii]KAB2542003.1 C4-dicarboxylate ABC transporter permease [Salipiger aestuarii]RAK15601.1 C4-dicarboxylate transporter DctM subunit [Salipiger aestuarii]
MLDISAGSQMLILFALLLLLRVPVAFSLGMSSLYAMWQMGFGLDLVGDLVSSGITKFSLLAIPFFILAGMLMGTAGLADRMVRFFRILIGGMPGGMGVVGVVVSLFWGAVSGSGPASVAAIGPMIMRGMVEDGYSRAYAAALVCTGAALSIVIPPSIGLVVYGVIAEVSIGALFIAAILPGLVMGVMMLATLPFARRGLPDTQGRLARQNAEELALNDAPWLTQLWHSFRAAIWGLFTPVVILGGIYVGIFTPTEAAIVAAVYAIILGFAYRSLTLETLMGAVQDAARASAVVMMVVTFASLFGWVVTVDDVVGKYSALLLSFSHAPFLVLMVMALVLLIAGMFMDAITIMFICLPIFLPVVHEMGWDPVWFGIFLSINLAIGLFTPPVGINLFVAANITGLSLERIAGAALPFLLSSAIGIAIVGVWPELTQYLLAWMK